MYIYIQYTPSNDVTYCCPSISPPKTPIRSLTRPQGKMRCKGTPSCYVKFTNRSPLAAGNGERFVESWESCYPFADPWLMWRKVYFTYMKWLGFWGEGRYDTWILWVMESYPPKPACFVKGWRYFDTLESLERPTTLLFWWLLSNHLPLLKADSPEGFFHLSSISFQGAKGLFHGGFGGFWFGTLR